MPHLVVRHAGVAKGDFSVLSTRFHRYCHDGLRPFSSFGHPGVLDHAGPVDLKEAAIVGPRPAFMLHREIEKTVYNRIQDHAVRPEPRPAGALGVDPDVEDFFGGGGNGSGNANFSKLHRDFSLYGPKYFSSRSRRTFQNCSYFRTHRATSRRGSGRISKVFSRPWRVRRTRPAR